MVQWSSSLVSDTYVSLKLWLHNPCSGTPRYRLSLPTKETVGLTDKLIPKASHIMEITPNSRRIKAPRHSTQDFRHPGLSCTHPHVAMIFRTEL